MTATRLNSFLLALALAGTGAAAIGADAPAVAVSASAAVSAPGLLPDLNADDYFQGKTPGTFGKDMSAVLLPLTKRVAIVGFTVVFVTENSASAQVRGSYLPGRETTGAHASINVKLQGVDDATLQAVTDKAYNNFVAQLKAAGREVLTPDQVAPLYSKLELTESTPAARYKKDVDGRVGIAYTPTGMPLWWWTMADRFGNLGPFSQKNMRAVPSFSVEQDAIAIAPVIPVDFAKMESSGNHSGLVANEASVGAQLRMAVGGMGITMVRATEARGGGLMSKGEEGWLRMKKAVVAENSDFATMEQAEESKTSGFMALMTGSSKSKKMMTATTDNARYGAVATDVLGQATGALAKFFQQHSP